MNYIILQPSLSFHRPSNLLPTLAALYHASQVSAPHFCRLSPIAKPVHLAWFFQRYQITHPPFRPCIHPHPASLIQDLSRQQSQAPLIGYAGPACCCSTSAQTDIIPYSGSTESLDVLSLQDRCLWLHCICILYLSRLVRVLLLLLSLWYPGLSSGIER